MIKIYLEEMCELKQLWWRVQSGDGKIMRDFIREEDARFFTKSLLFEFELVEVK